MVLIAVETIRKLVVSTHNSNAAFSRLRVVLLHSAFGS
jgi:hypothetical protein